MLSIFLESIYIENWFTDIQKSNNDLLSELSIIYEWEYKYNKIKEKTTKFDKRKINIWLQVEIQNEIALKFYDSLGLNKLFNYYYLQKLVKE